MCHRADYDRAYNTPEDAYNPPRCNYDYMYGAPEDAYYPPRRNYIGHSRAPPVQYYLDDDTAINSFAAFTPRLKAVDWLATFEPVINKKYDGRSDPTIWLKTYSTVVI